MSKIVVSLKFENVIIVFFFQAEDGIRDTELWLEFRRVLFRSDDDDGDDDCDDDDDDDDDGNMIMR